MRGKASVLPIAGVATPAGVLALQRAAGNRATTAALGRTAASAAPPPTVATTTTLPPKTIAPTAVPADAGGLEGQLAQVVARRVQATILSLALPGGQMSGAVAPLVDAFADGMAKQLLQEILREGKGLRLIARLMTYSPAAFGKGYVLGLGEGLVSPATDLFGLVVLLEQARNFAQRLLASSLAHGFDPVRIAADIEEVLGAVAELSRGQRRMWEEIKRDPELAIIAILSVPDTISDAAQCKARELGASSASQLVRSLESPWAIEEPANERKRTLSDWLSSPATSLASVAEAGEESVLDSPWARIGNKVGYTVSWVAIQIVLLAVTEGVGNAFEQLAAGLGRLARALGEVSEGLGKVVAGGAKWLAATGRAIAAIGEVFDLLAAKALKPVAKQLEAIFEPLGKLLSRLQQLLQDLFGVAEREGVHTAEIAAAKSAAAPTKSPPLSIEPAPAPATPALGEAVAPPHAPTVAEATPSTRTISGEAHPLSVRPVGDKPRSDSYREMIARAEAMLERLPAKHKARGQLASFIEGAEKRLAPIRTRAEAESALVELQERLEKIERRYPGAFDADAPAQTKPAAGSQAPAPASPPPPTFEERVLFGAPDEHGRASYVTGELHPSDLHTGTKTGTVYPPGLERGELDPLGARRGHLLANLFGGKGTDRRNLVWLHEVVNNSAYKTQFENLVADALRRGEKVRFSIEPHFRGIELAPYRIEVWAEGETGTVVTHRSIITIGLSDI